MKGRTGLNLAWLKIKNFQSVGEDPVTITLEDETTYLIGPNGSGKTVVLQTLCRLFGFNPAMRRIQPSDFHVPFKEIEPPSKRELWIEAEFVFPELEKDGEFSTIPPFFNHMRLDSIDGSPRVRYRLTAEMGMDGDIEEKLEYVLNVDLNNNPLNLHTVRREERNYIQVHYLPAQRNPSEHISYGTNALLGRILRAVNWGETRDEVKKFSDQVSESLADNPSINTFSAYLTEIWKKFHKSTYFKDPKVNFVGSDIEALLRHLSISFSPSHDSESIDYSRLSDGQKSMLYLSLVLSAQAIYHAVLADKNDSFALEKLHPPIFTLIALEEPENSLSPHYLGRIVNAISDATNAGDAQALIATHAPSMLKRINPKDIRYLRLNEKHLTVITKILLPQSDDEAYKFVRGAVQAFPEIYFSRLVILGEGDSEEIVLPRLLQAYGTNTDASAITVTPLGGRHVNHFWRLLSELKIPYLTLLDLDVARFGGGWGRYQYVNNQLLEYKPDDAVKLKRDLPKWDSDKYKVRECSKGISVFEEKNVYFSSPLDLDFSMMNAFPTAYGASKKNPDESIITSVLGKKHHDSSQYTEEELNLFPDYHKLFKIGSKPVIHISALTQLTDEELIENMPDSYKRLSAKVLDMLDQIPEL